jgi:hypothetical protein
VPRNRNGSGSEKRITPRQAKAIAALLEAPKWDVPAAAAAAGMHERSLYKALAQAHVQEHIQAKAKSHISGVLVTKAAHRLGSLIHAESEYVSLDASKHALAIAGVKPRADGSAGGARGGLVINLNLSHAHASPLLDAITRAPSVQPAMLEAQPLDAHED